MSNKSSAAATAVFGVPKADKGDATTRAARAIIDQETASRDAKTARLRAARLARDAELAAVEAQKPAVLKKAAAKPRKRAAARA
jgi:hypothetical protein